MPHAEQVILRALGGLFAGLALTIVVISTLIVALS